MEKMEIRSENELNGVVAETLKKITEKRQGSRASVLALHGDLGAGKTAFVKALAASLGVEEDVTSPTFVIMKLYEIGEGQSFKQLVHIDAYRIETPDEMRVLHFEDILASEHTLVCIEWAEKIDSLLPPHTVHMTLTINGEMREVVFS